MHTKWNLTALIAGGLIGLKLPDVDHWMPLLVHRSIVTHSFLASLLVIALSRRGPAVSRRWFAAGVSLATAIHLAFDLFPKQWFGYALIHVPGYGWTNSLFSVFWLLTSACVCQFIAVTLLRQMRGLRIGGAFGLVLFGMAAGAESGIALQALLVLIGITGAMLWFLRNLKKPV